MLVGEKRVAAAEALLNERAVDFIVCDDAFQHRRLHRDLNVLLIDATEPVRNYRVVPVGRARESVAPRCAAPTSWCSPRQTWSNLRLC